jgi:hypothetical protein
LYEEFHDYPVLFNLVINKFIVIRSGFSACLHLVCYFCCRRSQLRSRLLAECLNRVHSLDDPDSYAAQIMKRACIGSDFELSDAIHMPVLDSSVNLPRRPSFDSTIESFCSNMSVNVLNKLVSGETHWLIVLLAHMENSQVSFSMHAQARSSLRRQQGSLSRNPIVYSNKSMARLYGYTRASIQGRQFDFAAIPVETKRKFSHRIAPVGPLSSTGAAVRDTPSLEVDEESSLTGSISEGSKGLKHVIGGDVTVEVDICPPSQLVELDISTAKNSAFSTSPDSMDAEVVASRDDIDSFVLRMERFMRPGTVLITCYRIMNPCSSNSSRGSPIVAQQSVWCGDQLQPDRSANSISSRGSLHDSAKWPVSGASNNEPFYATIVVAVKAIFETSNNSLIYHLVLHSEVS